MQSETSSKYFPAIDDSRGLSSTDGDKLVLFSGKIVRKNGALAFLGPLVQFFLTVAMGKAVWLQKVGEQEEICVGVRAKYIRVDDGFAKDIVHILGSVEKKSLDGLNNYVSVRVGKDRIIVKAENAIEFNHGAGIRLNFSRRNAFLFRCPLDSIDLDAMPLALSIA
jgi:ABC-type sugar transport system ATPase subunit